MINGCQASEATFWTGPDPMYSFDVETDVGLVELSKHPTL